MQDLVVQDKLVSILPSSRKVLSKKKNDENINVPGEFSRSLSRSYHRNLTMYANTARCSNNDLSRLDYDLNCN